ncbi:uncharacterized protein PpBr36_09730 [Pyricularia pennisetigena]|nr:uncharacterized protein PpBr36_09730 [Pyricularia pennisetigena]TLS22290.1 hypothetical protein PpBr36_09730 [Pyricularia pennisetigena]
MSPPNHIKPILQQNTTDAPKSNGKAPTPSLRNLANLDGAVRGLAPNSFG